MDQAVQVLEVAHNVYARQNATSPQDADDETRPPYFKIVGICLAISSGAFIGTSFVLKKVGLLKANEKYNEAAGEGYGYLKNAFWWSGMTLMILGEICNFVAYAFTDAILVTPLGALAVVITTILSAIFLKERLSMVGKVACFLCIIGSVVIVLNAPEESSVANIQEMQHYFITPSFLGYAGAIIVGSVVVAVWVGPRWGKRNMLVYISICSWIGGLSVVATQGLGAAIVAQVGGEPQFNQWFTYVLMVFVIATLLTEIIYLNKALNLFNAAMVTPTYYVYFTSTTIITSAVLFRGFKGTAVAIVSVVMGFLTICSGVVLLQLSKSAKDVPDTAVFTGNLDQIHTIAEQEQPETEPKADAIRGTVSIVRRFSGTRQKMEQEELKRLREETERDHLAPLSEDGMVEQFEWDGLRRRRTTFSSAGRSSLMSPNPFASPANPVPERHPPLGMSHFPSQEELDEAERRRQDSPSLLSSVAGTIRSRGRSMILPGHPDFSQNQTDAKAQQSPMHPVQLADISVPAQKLGGERSPAGVEPHTFGLPVALQHQKTAYEGAAGVMPGDTGVSGRHVEIAGAPKPGASISTGAAAPTPPPHAASPSARRQFSFQNMFRRHQTDGPQDTEDGQQAGRPGSRPRTPSRLGGVRARNYGSPHVKNATEEEQAGLVSGDSRTLPALPRFDEVGEEEEYDDRSSLDDDSRYGRRIAGTPPRRGSGGSGGSGGSSDGSDLRDKEEEADYAASRARWDERRAASTPHDSPPGQRITPPRPPPPGPRGGTGAFI